MTVPGRTDLAVMAHARIVARTVSVLTATARIGGKIGGKIAARIEDRIAVTIGRTEATVPSAPIVPSVSTVARAAMIAASTATATATAIKIEHRIARKTDPLTPMRRIVRQIGAQIAVWTVHRSVRSTAAPIAHRTAPTIGRRASVSTAARAGRIAVSIGPARSVAPWRMTAQASGFRLS
jgi:hypothetical protein